GIRPEEVEDLVLAELRNSPLFGLRFRENAGRALLLPRDRPGRRTPLWLRRLSARDLLEAARVRPGFPIVTETYREILADFLPMDALRAWLHAVERGETRVAVRRGLAPSPFAAALLWEFQAAYLYQWDEPKPGPVPAGLAEEELASLLGRDLAESLDPSVMERVERGLRGIGEGQWARTGAELLSHLHRLGDVSPDEIPPVASPEARAALPDLLAAGTLVGLDLAEAEPRERIVPGEDAPLYQAAWGGDREAQAEVVRRHVGSRALATRSDLRRRYPFPEKEIESALDTSPFVAVTWQGEKAWTRRETLERLRHLTLAARRARIHAHGPAALQAFVLRHQHRVPGSQLTGADGVAQVLTELQGIALPWALWDGEILPTRVEGYRPVLVEELLRSGEFLWLGRPGPGKDLAVVFARRNDLPWLAKVYPRPDTDLHSEGQVLLERLTARGASFLVEISGDLGLPAARCTALLWDLARTGLVTNDGLAPLQVGPPPPKPGKTRIWQGGSGRWSLVPSPSQPPGEEELLGLVRLLLTRYGIVSRQILALDGAAVAWGALYPLLTRMEWRGELVRGLFVAGLAGAQFAREETLSGLECREPGWILLSTADPAVVYGAGAPFPVAHPTDVEGRIRRGPGTYLVLRGGRPLLAIEGWGERLTTLADLSSEELQQGL
ncbi:MAG: hypothetical protein FJ098_14455, partial [Deltaproteobacteria bacterium]|nr:hypothetical protein [Deltaproteobacteria bacterium]